MAAIDESVTPPPPAPAPDAGLLTAIDGIDNLLKTPSGLSCQRIILTTYYQDPMPISSPSIPICSLIVLSPQKVSVSVPDENPACKVELQQKKVVELDGKKENVDDANSLVTEAKVDEAKVDVTSVLGKTQADEKLKVGAPFDKLNQTIEIVDLSTTTAHQGVLSPTAESTRLIAADRGVRTPAVESPIEDDEGVLSPTAESTRLIAADRGVRTSTVESPIAADEGVLTLTVDSATLPVKSANAMPTPAYIGSLTVESPSISPTSPDKADFATTFSGQSPVSTKKRPRVDEGDELGKLVEDITFYLLRENSLPDHFMSSNATAEFERKFHGVRSDSRVFFLLLGKESNFKGVAELLKLVPVDGGITLNLELRFINCEDQTLGTGSIFLGNPGALSRLTRSEALRTLNMIGRDKMVEVFRSPTKRQKIGSV